MAAEEDVNLVEEALNLVGSLLNPEQEVFFMNELKKKLLIEENDQVNEAQKRELALVLIGCLYMLAGKQNIQGKTQIGKIAQKLNQLIRGLPISFYGYHDEYIQQALSNSLPKNYVLLVTQSGFMEPAKKHDLELVLQGGLLVSGKPLPTFESIKDNAVNVPSKKTSAFPSTGIIGFSAGGVGLAVALFVLFSPPAIIGTLAITAVVEIFVGAVAGGALLGTLIGVMGDRKRKQISSVRQSSSKVQTSGHQPGFNIELTRLGKGRSVHQSAIIEDEQSLTVPIVATSPKVEQSGKHVDTGKSSRPTSKK